MSTDDSKGVYVGLITSIDLRRMGYQTCRLRRVSSILEPSQGDPGLQIMP
jgi:hypothetical protein